MAAIAERRAEQARLNKFERMKLEKDGLDVLPDIERYAELGDADQISADDAQRMKWFGLFVRKQTPGHMMMRLRAVGGRMNSAQWRLFAGVSGQVCKGIFTLITTA